MEATETEIQSPAGEGRDAAGSLRFDMHGAGHWSLFALTFIFQNFEIPSSSMEKTLAGGRPCAGGSHYAWRRRTKWAPFVYYRNVHRGDVIVFFKPGEPDLYLVKRVIGIPGDRIHLRNGVVLSQRQTAVGTAGCHA